MGNYEFTKGEFSSSEESCPKANHYDYLTGLPSMTYFFELAEAGQKAMLEKGDCPVLLYIDLSGMKYYNHKYSFREGDKLLRSFANLLSSIFHNENCCHIGADHFTVLTDKNGLEDTLHELFQKWHDINTERHLPICAGIYPNWSEDIPVSMASDMAKIACDALKGAYTSSFNYYNQKLNDDFVKQQYILDNFDRALSEKWIQVYYQPIMRAMNSRVCDEEALARWNDPVKGFLSPMDFIPYLEDMGIIYKLDLYMLEHILENIKTKEAEGIYIVPHSINLSRSDFDACDMVEEVRRRVDEAGVSRNRISIEITESIIGSNFSFMKEQIERFQALGFPVWMDDFGSGYSALDVLQSIKFDLLKFDMNFMRKLDESVNGRIILTELMKMALALGVDTICEGVETEDQVRFLQEIGCSKLQGFYFSKPIPMEEALEWHKNHKQDGYENPAESAYYESVCSVNFYDLDVIAHDEDSLQNTFNTLPMGIVEIKGDTTRFVRSNQSYRDFVKRFIGLDISYLGSDFAKFDNAFMNNIVKTCCEQGIRSFYDEKMRDGSIVHSFARKISTNPINGNIAVAIAVLSISEPYDGATYVDIARALAADYYNIYVVDLETDKYIEYTSPVGRQEMAMERHGEDFFNDCKKDSYRIYEEDRENFFDAFSKERIIKTLDETGVFTTTYRLMDSGEPVFVNMKVIRMQPGGNQIIIGISIIEAQIKQKERYEKLQRDKATLVRVMALTDGYLSLYTVDPETERYVEFSASEDYENLGTPKEGDDFFEQSRMLVPKILHPEDAPLFLKEFSKENVLRSISEEGYFSTNYRIMIEGRPQHVVLRIAPFKDGEETRLLVSVRKWRERH